MIKLFNIDKSTYISSAEPTKNFGSIHQLYVANFEEGFFESESTARSLIYFNVNNILNEIDFTQTNFDIELVFNISLFSVKNHDFNLHIHPLITSFEEGFSTELYSSDGANWYNASKDISWDEEGGDYDDQYDFSYIFDEENNMLRVNITDYLTMINDGVIDNKGIIIIGDENVNTLAFYSNNDPSNLSPKIYLKKNDYNLDGDIENEYDEEELGTPKIKLLKYKSNVYDGEKTQHVLNIIPSYVRKGTWIDSKFRYFDGVKYAIRDVTRNKIIINYSDYTKVDVEDSMLIHNINFANFPSGTYEINYQYNNYFGEPTRIVVENKYD